MLKLKTVWIYLCVAFASLLFIQGTNSEKKSCDIKVIYHGIQCVIDFYGKNSRLPANQAELEKYAKDAKTELDLSNFKIFNFVQKNDSLIVIDFELKAPSQSKGTFEFKPEKKK
jgi:hypothetical protein